MMMMMMMCILCWITLVLNTHHPHPHLTSVFYAIMGCMVWLKTTPDSSLIWHDLYSRMPFLMWEEKETIKKKIFRNKVPYIEQEIPLLLLWSKTGEIMIGVLKTQSQWSRTKKVRTDISLIKIAATYLLIHVVQTLTPISTYSTVSLRQFQLMVDPSKNAIH